MPNQTQLAELTCRTNLQNQLAGTQIQAFGFRRSDSDTQIQALRLWKSKPLSTHKRPVLAAPPTALGTSATKSPPARPAL